MVEKSAEKLRKSVATCLVGMVIYISWVIPKWLLRATFKLDYFNGDLCWNRTGRFKQSFGNGVDMGSGERVVPLGPFLLVKVCNYI